MKTKLISVLLFFIPLIAAKSYKTTGNSAITVSVKDFGAVGDGLHHDDTAIVKAIARLQSQGGGTLYFPTGWYRIVHSITKGEPEYVISIPDNISIQATGAVIGNTNDGAFCFRTTGQNISWTGGTIRKGGIEICSSYVTFTGLKSEYAWGHAFHLNSGKSNQSSDIHMLYRNITIQNCTALYPGRHGFALHRKNTVFGASDSAFLGEYLNIKFTNDSSFHAGTSLISPFDYGFGMENIVAATNVTFKNCFSYESQGAGFHVEYQIKTAGISYISSSAKRNGLSGRNGYPYGFMYRDAGFTISDCQTDSNYGGAYAMIPSFTGGQVNFVNSGERGFSKVSYNSNSTDNTKFVSNFAGYAVRHAGQYISEEI